MNKLTKSDIEEIRLWMYRNARPLDLARWQYHFESGSKEAVLKALSVYQNEDGGFGHALDCDNWNPNSTPYNVGQAFNILKELEIYDPQLPMVSRAFRYLADTPLLSADGWPFTIPSNDDYPHAPWWNYSEENNRQNGFHATGSLVAYILRCQDSKSGLYMKALDIADKMIEKANTAKEPDAHEIIAFCVVLQAIKDSSLENRFDIASLEKTLLTEVHSLIERDLNNWSSYCMLPSYFISFPDSIFYPENKDALEKELDLIISSRCPGGVWNITWQWGAYPDEFAVSKRWWMGLHSVTKMLLLKSFERL